MRYLILFLLSFGFLQAQTVKLTEIRGSSVDTIEIGILEFNYAVQTAQGTNVFAGQGLRRIESTTHIDSLISRLACEGISFTDNGIRTVVNRYYVIRIADNIYNTKTINTRNKDFIRAINLVSVECSNGVLQTASTLPATPFDNITATDVQGQIEQVYGLIPTAATVSSTLYVSESSGVDSVARPGSQFFAWKTPWAARDYARDSAITNPFIVILDGEFHIGSGSQSGIEYRLTAEEANLALDNYTYFCHPGVKFFTYRSTNWYVLDVDTVSTRFLGFAEIGSGMPIFPPFFSFSGRGQLDFQIDRYAPDGASGVLGRFNAVQKEGESLNVSVRECIVRNSIISTHANNAIDTSVLNATFKFGLIKGANPIVYEATSTQQDTTVIMGDISFIIDQIIVEPDGLYYSDYSLYIDEINSESWNVEMDIRSLRNRGGTPFNLYTIEKFPKKRKNNSISYNVGRVDGPIGFINSDLNTVDTSQIDVYININGTSNADTSLISTKNLTERFRVRLEGNLTSYSPIVWAKDSISFSLENSTIRCPYSQFAEVSGGDVAIINSVIIASDTSNLSVSNVSATSSYSVPPLLTTSISSIPKIGGENWQSETFTATAAQTDFVVSAGTLPIDGANVRVYDDTGSKLRETDHYTHVAATGTITLVTPASAGEKYTIEYYQ